MLNLRPFNQNCDPNPFGGFLCVSRVQGLERAVASHVASEVENTAPPAVEDESLSGGGTFTLSYVDDEIQS